MAEAHSNQLVFLDNDEIAQRYRAQPARAGEVLERGQRAVEDLWLEGASQSRIAAAVGVSTKTVQRDLRVIQTRYAVEQLPNLGRRITAHIASYNAVKQHAYAMFYSLKDSPTAQNARLLYALYSTRNARLRRWAGARLPAR